MKRIISLILACMMIFGALTLSSCVPIKEKDGDAQSTTTAGTTATTAPQEPVPVDSVNGMNAKQLFEKFFEDFTNSRSFDFDAVITTVEEGVTVTENVEFKLDESGELYVSMSMDGTDMKIWFVDGTVYVDMGGEKYKSSNQDVDDIFGEGLFDEFISIAPDGHYDAYIKKIEGAQIYSYGGIYYFSFSVTAEEAKQMEQGDEAYTETVYFNSSGNITKIVDRSATSTMTLNLNSYGKSVTITPPADPDSFMDITPQYSAEYAVYRQILDVLRDATVYSMNVELNGEPYVLYQTDGIGEYVCVYESENIYQVWSGGGNKYAFAHNEQASKVTSLTEEMRSAFEAAALVKDVVLEPVDESEIDAITLESAWGMKILAFEIQYSADECVVCVITFDDSYSYIHIEITEYSGQSVSASDFYFKNINDENFKVVVPA